MSFRADEHYADVVSLDERRNQLDGRPVPIAHKIAEREKARQPTLGAADLHAHIEQLTKSLLEVETELTHIRCSVDPRSLGASVVGLMGNSAQEIRRQIRPLREALKDQGGDAA